MSAGDALSPKQFPLFHGARSQINDTHVRPPAQTGATTWSSSNYSSGSDRPAHTDLAFATPTEHVAWRYAQVVPQHQDHPVNNDPDPKHRSRVYTVDHAKDEHTDDPSSSEIESGTGFKITGAHDIEPGATGTFPTHNWNAFKPRSKVSPLVSHMDLNHSYMQGGTPSRTAEVKHVELPGQMNLFSGATHEEHTAYENTPGFALGIHAQTSHMPSKQFSQDRIAQLDRDPSSKVLRHTKKWHHMDEELGTVH